MRKFIAAAVIAAGALLAGVPSAPAAQPVALPAPVPAPAPAPVVPPAPPVEHTVTVKVSGPEGSLFQVSGAVFGDTGLINMPPMGSDSASFTTDATGDLGLSVSVMPGPNPRTCAIEIDGATMVTNTADGDNPVTCKSTRSA